MELGVTLRQGMDQRLLLLPKMLQAIELLQLSTQDLLTRIDVELQSNETLELLPRDGDAATTAGKDRDQRYGDVDDYGRGSARADEDRDDRFARVAAPSLSLQGFLLQQLGECEADPRMREVAAFVVGSVDGNGHLALNADEIAVIFEVEVEVARAAVALVQSLEPLGVAQSGPRDAMLAQLDADHARFHLLTQLVCDHLEDLAANRWPRVAKTLGVTIDELRILAQELRTLDPCPGRAFSQDEDVSMRADVVVRREDGEWQIYVDDARVPPLRVQPEYKALAKRKDTDRDVRRYLRGKIDSARELLVAIAQRKETLGRVARATLERQRVFLERGLAGLKPLGMQEIADAVGVHLSTVSRAIAGKHVQTDFGIFPLRILFDGGKGVGGRRANSAESSTSASGTASSRMSIQERIKALVAGEDPATPLSDEALVEALARHGVEVARRTVAKYRKELGIASSFRRRRH